MKLPPFVLTTLVGVGLIAAATLWPGRARNQATEGEVRSPKVQAPLPAPPAKGTAEPAVECRPEVTPILVGTPVSARVREIPTAAVPARQVKKTAAVDLVPMLFLFQRELDLSFPERQHFERVLDERECAVAELQDEVVRSGVLCRTEYDRRVRKLQSQYYDRMGNVLDAGRHRRFFDLLAQGRVGDSVVFEIPAGLEVRD